MSSWSWRLMEAGLFLNRHELVQQLVPPGPPAHEVGAAYAPANIALVKYWGKRQQELNLPVTGSFSVSLADRGTHTTIQGSDGRSDVVVLNGVEQGADSPFYQRVIDYLDLFRGAGQRFCVETRNTIPTAAGLASSASGFAALVKALNALFGWGLSDRTLSILARLGSGSACRSLFDGFVLWHGGQRDDGMDSYAEACPGVWSELCVGLLPVSLETKKIGSRPAMNRTVDTSPLYASWPCTVARHLQEIIPAAQQRKLDVLGPIAEQSALAMHATMAAAWPPIVYWTPRTVAHMQQVWKLRADGLPVYLTMDAGPNPKLLFEAGYEETLRAEFPHLEIIKPFVQIEA